MKCIGALWCDLVHSPLGTRSRLADEIAGQPVLRRTLKRVLGARRLGGVHLLCPADQAERVRQLVSNLSVEVETHQSGLPPYAQLVIAGRWWGLDSWRGGVGGLTVYDEDIHLDVLRALAARRQADAVMSIAASAAVIEPAMIDELIKHYEDNAGATRMTFVQAPPGLGAMVLGRDLLDELAPTGQPPGAILTYHPDRPITDLTGREACYRPAFEVIEARGRLLCDTRRSFDRLCDLIRVGGENWDTRRIAQWLLVRESLVRESLLAPTPTGIPSRGPFVEPIPTEIEIELTTDVAQPPSGVRQPTHNLLHPRCLEVPQRGPIRQSVIQAVIEAIKDNDDVRIVLGGFGDPCLHPAFAEICGSLRRSTTAAIAVRTAGLLPSDDDVLEHRVEAALFETPVDLIEVTLDAATAETYQRVHGIDGYERAVARLERWIDRRMQRQQVRPLIVPSFVKARENLDDMEAFFDRWQGRLGTALITGYSHFAGQRPDRAVTSMVPPQRGVCRRTLSRAMILADGRMTTCDQDFAGRQTVGVVGKEPFEKLWRSERLERIRTNRIDDMPLCPHCDEWHRP